jgi:hypothetical protein
MNRSLPVSQKYLHNHTPIHFRMARSLQALRKQSARHCVRFAETILGLVVWARHLRGARHAAQPQMPQRRETGSGSGGKGSVCNYR